MHKNDYYPAFARPSSGEKSCNVEQNIVSHYRACDSDQLPIAKDRRYHVHHFLILHLPPLVVCVCIYNFGGLPARKSSVEHLGKSYCLTYRGAIIQFFNCRSLAQALGKLNRCLTSLTFESSIITWRLTMSSSISRWIVRAYFTGNMLRSWGGDSQYQCAIMD